MWMLAPRAHHGSESDSDLLFGSLPVSHEAGKGDQEEGGEMTDTPETTEDLWLPPEYLDADLDGFDDLMDAKPVPVRPTGSTLVERRHR